MTEQQQQRDNESPDGEVSEVSEVSDVEDDPNFDYEKYARQRRGAVDHGQPGFMTERRNGIDYSAGEEGNAVVRNELERTGGRYGLQTMCEGGGQANVTIIERLT